MEVIESLMSFWVEQMGLMRIGWGQERLGEESGHKESWIFQGVLLLGMQRKGVINSWRELRGQGRVFFLRWEE